jgi:hypothetical protein
MLCLGRKISKCGPEQAQFFAAITFKNFVIFD